MLQGLFKQRKPRKFNYKSRYYDRENGDIRKEKILNGDKDTDVNFGDRFCKRVEENRKRHDNSMRKLAIMLAALALLLFVISRL